MHVKHCNNQAPCLPRAHCKQTASVLKQESVYTATDAYCLVFLSEPYGESVTGAVTFRTETIKNRLDPVWNADMELPIMPGATALTVALFDFDSLTSVSSRPCFMCHSRRATSIKPSLAFSLYVILLRLLSVPLSRACLVYGMSAPCLSHTQSLLGGA